MDFKNQVFFGKNEIVLKDFPDNYFDSIVTDPPYGLKFMGKKWDYDVPTVEQWKEIYRVLKPGGHIISFGGTRTYHRLVVNIEDAGFEIRDQLAWIYAEGFPKSMNIEKALNGRQEANEWQGWGTALKPAQEPICLARKPIAENTIADNVLLYRTGGINIDASRIPLNGEKQPTGSAKRIYASNQFTDEKIYGENKETSPLGRFPSNVIMDTEAGKILDKQVPKAGAFAAVKGTEKSDVNGQVFENRGYDRKPNILLDEGGASRFFYCPKPDTFEKEKGLKEFELREAGIKNESGRGFSEADPYKKVLRRNTHPTVKPIDLMRYLVKLVTPKGGIVLDPWCGSGTTLCGAKMELINYVGIDEDEYSFELSKARVLAWNPDIYKPQTLF